MGGAVQARRRHPPPPARIGRGAEGRAGAAAGEEGPGKVALGEDPQADRVDRRGKDLLTMRSQADEYLAAKEKELATADPHRDASATSPTRALRAAARHAGRHRSPARISRRRVVVIMRERGNPTAARARARSAAFSPGQCAWGWSRCNPTIGSVAPAEDGGRDRVLSDSELAAIWRACGDDDYGRIIRLLALGAWRSGRDRRHVLERARRPRAAHHLHHPGGAHQEWQGPHVAADATMVRIIIRGAADGNARSVVRAALPRLHPLASVARLSWMRVPARSAGRSMTFATVVATRMADLGVQPHIIEAVLNHQSGHKRRPRRHLQPEPLRATRCAPRSRCGKTMFAADRRRRAQSLPYAPPRPLEAERGHVIISTV